MNHRNFRLTRSDDDRLILGLVIVFVTALLVATAVGLLAQAAGATNGDHGGGHTPVTICHKPGTPAEHTIVVDDDAVPAHLAHGDYLGPCQETPPPTDPPTTTVPEPPVTTVPTPPVTPPSVTEPPQVSVPATSVPPVTHTVAPTPVVATPRTTG